MVSINDPFLNWYNPLLKNLYDLFEGEAGMILYLKLIQFIFEGDILIYEGDMFFL